MESSLAIMKRRGSSACDTNCCFVAPGVESWGDYSNKARVGVKHDASSRSSTLRSARSYVPGLQANFIFGLDNDSGTAPVELTKSSSGTRRSCFPINIPTPSAAPLLHVSRAAHPQGVPFVRITLYYRSTIRHYNTVEFYDRDRHTDDRIHADDLQAHHVADVGVFPLMSRCARWPIERRCRAPGVRRLASDRELLSFHEGKSRRCPGPPTPLEQRMGTMPRRCRGRTRPLLRRSSVRRGSLRSRAIWRSEARLHRQSAIGQSVMAETSTIGQSYRQWRGTQPIADSQFLCRTRLPITRLCTFHRLVADSPSTIRHQLLRGPILPFASRGARRCRRARPTSSPDGPCACCGYLRADCR